MRVCKSVRECVRVCERMDFCVRGRKREGGRGQGKSVLNVFAENPEENIK